MPDRRVVGGVHLVRIVAAPVQAPDVLVAHVGDHLLELRVAAEEAFPGIGAALGLEGLVLPVDRLLHAVAKQSGGVLVEQGVPVRAPDHLEHLPSRAVEGAFELLDDLAVAAHRAVEALQVAVDDENEIVELFPRGEGDGAHGLGLVHLAVAHEGPYLAPLGVEQAAVVQVLHEAGLVDGHDRSEAHGYRRKLPEVGHQPGMRIGRQAPAVDFPAEAVQPVLGDAAFEVGARVDSGALCPWKNTRSPPCDSVGACQKWLKPTS